MTVSELLDKLKNFDKDAEVVFWDTEGEEYSKINFLEYNEDLKILMLDFFS